MLWSSEPRVVSVSRWVLRNGVRYPSSRSDPALPPGALITPLRGHLQKQEQHDCRAAVAASVLRAAQWKPNRALLLDQGTINWSRDN
jgi:hypothetical protein